MSNFGQIIHTWGDREWSSLCYFTSLGYIIHLWLIIPSLESRLCRIVYAKYFRSDTITLQIILTLFRDYLAYCQKIQKSSPIFFSSNLVLSVRGINKPNSLNNSGRNSTTVHLISLFGAPYREPHITINHYGDTNNVTLSP